jgi:hypothetical protein
LLVELGPSESAIEAVKGIGIVTTTWLFACPFLRLLPTEPVAPLISSLFNLCYSYLNKLKTDGIGFLGKSRIERIVRLASVLASLVGWFLASVGGPSFPCT